MNIGTAARMTGLTVKTLRYYDELGLVCARRSENGYRDFDGRAVSQLHMLAQARHLGFSLDECRRLLELDADPARASRDVQALAVRNLDSVRDKIRQLQALEVQLETLIDQCHGNDAPDCAILDSLSGQARG